MTSHQALQLALAASRESLPGMDILRRRGTDVLIARVPAPGSGTVIVKCWNRPGPRGALRRLTRTNIGHREATALRRLEALNTPAPRCLAYLTLPKDAPHTEALLSTDLGPCRDSTDFFKHLLAHHPEQVPAFNQSLLHITRNMIQQGLLDPDHRLPNIVITPQNTPVRIDFELCIPVRTPRLHPRLLGDMIGIFLGSYVFAVQPRLDTAEAFARDLLRLIPLSPPILRRAQTTLDAMIQRQHRETGILSPLNLIPLQP